MLKNYLEAELAASMHKALIKKASNVEDNNLHNAVDYLNSAIDILQDAGLQSKANKVLKVLEKIAFAENDDSPVDLSTDSNVNLDLLDQARKGDREAIIKVTTMLSEQGYSSELINNLLMPEPEETFVSEISEEPIPSVDTMFTEASRKHKRPKDPRKISDRHTKNLTSEKMIENLKHHGTVFNAHDISFSDDLGNIEIDTDNLDAYDDLDSDLTFED